MRYLVIFLFCITLIPQLGVTTTLCVHNGKVNREKVHFSHSSHQHVHEESLANCEYNHDHVPVSECNHFDLSIIAPDAKILTHNSAVIQQLPFCFYIENGTYRGPPSQKNPHSTELLPPLHGLRLVRTAVITC